MKYDEDTFSPLSAIKPREVKWLWPRYLPSGLISVLEGDPNVGKSYLAMHIAAQVSAGGELPGASTLRRARVLYLSTEDEPDYTIRPRLEAMGADVNRIRILLKKDFPLDADGLRTLKREMDKYPPVLVIADTLFSFIPASTDTNKPNEVRAILSSVSELASDFDAAIVLIRHWTKGDRGKAIYRGSGSIDIIGLARSAIAVARHPDEPNFRVMAHVKHNLSPACPSLLFELVQTSPNALPRLEWRGETDLTAEDVQNSVASETKAIERATALLERELNEGSRLAKEIFAVAEKEGISQRTLDRAKKALDIKANKSGAAWHWELPHKERQRG